MGNNRGESAHWSAIAHPAALKSAPTGAPRSGLALTASRRASREGTPLGRVAWPPAPVQGLLILHCFCPSNRSSRKSFSPMLAINSSILTHSPRRSGIAQRSSSSPPVHGCRIAGHARDLGESSATDHRSRPHLASSRMGWEQASPLFSHSSLRASRNIRPQFVMADSL